MLNIEHSVIILRFNRTAPRVVYNTWRCVVRKRNDHDAVRERRRHAVHHRLEPEGIPTFRARLPHKIVDGCAENPKNDVFYMMLVEQQTGNNIFYFTSNLEINRIKSSVLRQRTNPVNKYMNILCMVNIGKPPVYVGNIYARII